MNDEQMASLHMAREGEADVGEADRLLRGLDRPAPAQRAPFGAEVEATRSYDKVFSVDEPLVLDVNNDIGAIEIRGGDAQVRVRATVRAWGSSQEEAEGRAAEVEVDIQQVGDDRVRVAGHVPPTLRVGHSPTVLLTVQVPRYSRVRVVSNVGEVRIRDIEGALDVQVHVGEIDVRGFSPRHDSALRTDVGRLCVGLPVDSAFHLDAHTSVGAIRSDFALLPHKARWPWVSDRVEGAVGNDPRCRLVLRTNMGEIRIIETADVAARRREVLARLERGESSANEAARTLASLRERDGHERTQQTRSRRDE
jgi:hypothetical protein